MVAESGQIRTISFTIIRSLLPKFPIWVSITEMSVQIFTSGKRIEKNLDTVLLQTNEKDFAVTVSTERTKSHQCGIAVENGNQISGIIKMLYKTCR